MLTNQIVWGQMQVNQSDKSIVYPQLSYQLMGALFKVHSKLGNTYQEKYYQRSIESELKNSGISFKREVEISLNYENDSIGRYFLDFVIDELVVLEVKAVPFISKEFEVQLYRYLKTADKKLGIIANFRTNKLTYEAPRPNGRGIFSEQLHSKSCSAVQTQKLSSAGLRPEFSAFVDKRSS